MSRRAYRVSSRVLAGVVVAIVAAWFSTPRAQGTGPMGLVVSRSVNMVAGDTWPNGDPFLQRQNEPSIAASTRNPLHLLAGTNDYRTVDLPGLSTGDETGDAWLGLFKSFDGGQRWQSTLLPGYPQDTSAEGMASPLKGFQAGADPVVRPGTNGLLYYAGLAFNRGENQPSAVFMSRFIDNNNKENGDPIRYLGTSIIDKSTGADFIDKPWMAVDVPRAGAKSCRIVVSDPPPAPKPGVRWGKYSGWKKREAEKAKKGKGKASDKGKANAAPSAGVAQSIAAGRIYVAYSRISGTGTAITSKIMFAQSDDCGATWSRPVQISNAADKVNQGATVAIDPRSGAVYVAWRQFGMTVTDTDSVMVARSVVPGKFDTATRVHKFKAHRPAERLRRMVAEHRFGDADEVSEIQPFDQGTAEDKFRTNAYPTMAVDDDGRVYLAWTQRGFAVARASDVSGDARVVLATARNGVWTAPRAVESGAAGQDLPGHQLMPSIAYSGGKLVIAFYDLREDVSQVFGSGVSDNEAMAVPGQDGKRRRHTIDIRAAYALKGDVPVFGPSQKVSQYLMGSLPGSRELSQLQYNTPNLPLFKLGTVPFMGDYIDLAPAPAFVQDARGAWGYNTAPTPSPVFHLVWTDNRDVKKPANGDWTDYTPPRITGVWSTFDPTQPRPVCRSGQTGMRNQNIYSARLTWGLVAGSPGNAKPLSSTLPRSFVVFATNTTDGVKSFRFSIAAQPVGGTASFSQEAPLASLDVSVPARSTVTRTVFATSTDPKASVPVDIKEITAPTLGLVVNGLASRVVLNPDISNPDISNPDISNPDISNPDISNAEVYNPDISNPDISNPDISNPDISNPDISNPDISNVVVANPDISNPDISNPDISNPDISNPDISNPDISNPDISNGSLTDVTWTIVNTGNTTASFNVNLFMANAAAKLGGVKTQLVVHKAYTTPTDVDCTVKQQSHMVLVANVPNPTFYAPGTTVPFNPTDPSVTNTTLWLEPGAEGKITLRIVDPNPQDAITINPARDVTPVITAEPKNTPDVGTPVPPPSTQPPAMPDVTLAFVAQPVNTAVNALIAPVTVLALSNAAPLANAQVTVAIAINPAGGHLSGTTTVLTDANGIATFNDLSIENAGVGYRLSASASAAGAVPDLSVAFNIGGAAPPPPPPPPGNATVGPWIAGGDGVVTLVNDGQVGGTPRMSYQNNGVFAGTWTLTTLAATGGNVRLDWEWTGFHSYCAASTRIEAFVNHGGNEVITGPFVNLTDNCVGANNPSAGFAFAGGTTLAVQAGDTLGFRMVGGHFDGSFVMEGNVNVVVNGLTSASPYVVTNAADGGPGSLRAAITAANAAADVNTITFAIPGAWIHTIAPQTPLPLVSTPMVIDGLSQPGAASMNPTINIDGRYLRNLVSSVPDDMPGTNIGQAPGFEVTTSGVTIRGLGINRFPGPAVFLFNGTNNVTVEDNAIGVAATGIPTWPANNMGVWANYSSNHVIARNTIGSSEMSGILLAGGSGTTITGNRIGLTMDGLGAWPNLDNGITMYDGTSGAVIDANYISGNGNGGVGSNGWGIDLQQSGGLARVTNTTITNNTIGLNVTGNLIDRSPAPDNYGANGPKLRGNMGGGIRAINTDGTVIGAGNVVSGNTGHGVEVTGTSATAPVIRGNYIGTDGTGTLGRGNVRDGVHAAVTGTVVGGLVAGQGNVISGNLKDGIEMSADGVSVYGNLIGTTATGMTALGNGADRNLAVNTLFGLGAGIHTNGTANQVIGDGTPAGRNLISGNGLGIAAMWGNQGLQVLGNNIGTNKDLSGFLPNSPNGDGEGGIVLYGGSGALITGNNISGNTGYGGGIFTGTGPVNASVGYNTITNNTGPGINLRGGPANAEPIAQMKTLSNVIFGNTGIAIDLDGDGATANDAGDGDTGSNLRQNYPTIAAATNAATTSVNFTLDSAAGPYLVEFFAGSACGRAEQVLGSVLANANAAVSHDLGVLVPLGTFVMATATDGAGNTSELSQCVQVVAGAPPAVITSVSPAAAAGGEGFVVARGANLPAGLGDMVAVVTNGVTTANGFAMFSPSSSSAVWVRLPAGFPLGAATLQLRNNASTIVSNAFPITIQAVQGTPVINAIRDTFENIIAAPVTAGSTIAVGADGMDTTGAAVRFTQGARTWDVTGIAASNSNIGLTLQVNVPGDASTGPIDVAIRQGGSAFSAPVAISVSNPGFIGTAGGPGGNPFGPVTCPVGSVLTKLTGESGSYMGRFTMWCAPVLPGPALGAEVATAVIGIAGVGPVDFGAALTCPAGSMITGIHGTAGNVGWGVVVDGLGVDCKDVATLAPYSSGMVGGQATAAFSFQCAAGDEAIGFAGGFGSVLDRIGIVCANRAVPAPVVPPVLADPSAPRVDPAWFEPRRPIV